MKRENVILKKEGISIESYSFDEMRLIVVVDKTDIEDSNEDADYLYSPVMLTVKKRRNAYTEVTLRINQGCVFNLKHDLLFVNIGGEIVSIFLPSELFTENLEMKMNTYENHLEITFATEIPFDEIRVLDCSIG